MEGPDVCVPWALLSVLLIMHPESPFGAVGRAKAGTDGQAPSTQEPSAHSELALGSPGVMPEVCCISRCGLQVKSPLSPSSSEEHRASGLRED